jgi:MFS superfamily sulfate permease-like transporter
MRAVKIIFAVLVAIIAFPFITLGVAIGVVVASAKAVVKAASKQALVVKPVGAKAQEPVVDKPIVDFNKFPFGREDKGGTA